MTQRSKGVPSLGTLAALTFLSCTGEPIRSTCEAYCDWAVSCHETERSIDPEAMRTACLQSTHERDGTCEKAEAGELDPATTQLVEPCVEAIDAATAAGECNPFVGTIDEIKASTPPGACAGAGPDTISAFDDTRESTQETGEQLCQRMADTYCQQAADCILGDFQNDIPQEVIDAVGGTPFELCVQQLDTAFTSDCTGNDLYAGEESIDDLNPTRQAARECLRDFTAVTCEQLTSGNPDDLPEFCAGAFSTPEQALAVATALYDLSETFAPYIGQ